jgi:hypothetical protein
MKREGIQLLRLDKEKYFAQRQLPNKKYYYFYNGQNYEMSLDYVIGCIDRTEEKCFFLLNELNATDDFLVDVYLQDLADERIQINLRNNLYDEISSSLLDTTWINSMM